MLKVVSSGLVLALCTVAVAQKSFTSPSGLQKTEGSSYGYYFGYTANGKLQILEGDFRGASPRVFTGVQYRRDSRVSAYTYRNQGRTWTSVSLQMSDSDFDKSTGDMAKNQTAPPTTVWSSAKYSLPTLTGFPKIKNPAIWGGLRNEFNFQFSKVWLHLGKADAALTWDFRGGKYANGYTSTYGLVYYLDGEYTNTLSSYIAPTYVPASRPACNDSSVTVSVGAYLAGSGAVYGENYGTVNLRKKAYIGTYSYYTAPGAPVMHAIGLINPAGASVGAKCNKLYINATYPMVFRTFRSIQGNAGGYSGLYQWYFPWRSIMANIEVMAQAAWSDSKTGQFALTSAVQLKLPGGPPRATIPRRALVYVSGSRSFKNTSVYLNPVARYLHK